MNCFKSYKPTIHKGLIQDFTNLHREYETISFNFIYDKLAFKLCTYSCKVSLIVRYVTCLIDYLAYVYVLLS